MATHTRLVGDPGGVATTLDLTSALYRDAPEHSREHARQTFRGSGSVRTNAPVLHTFHTGVLVLRVTGDELVDFHDTIAPMLSDGEVIRVYPDVALPHYVDVVLDADVWEEQYSRMFEGRDDWYTTEIPVAHDEEDSI